MKAKRSVSEELKNKLQSRKFQITLLLITLSTILVWFGKIDSAAWAGVNTVLAGAYPLANAWESRP